MKQLISDLSECAELCNECYIACLNEKTISPLARCIELTRECADVCQWTSSLITRDSEHAALFIVLCSQVCRDCAHECSKHEHEHCKICAEICETCAETCVVE